MVSSTLSSLWLNENLRENTKVSDSTALRILDDRITELRLRAFRERAENGTPRQPGCMARQWARYRKEARPRFASVISR